jgi:hypothetical protein
MLVMREYYKKIILVSEMAFVRHVDRANLLADRLRKEKIERF